MFALICIVMVVASLAQLWVLRETSRQQRRISRRIDELGSRTVARKRSGEHSGSLAPSFDLATLDGQQTSLLQIMEEAKPLLLVFADPRCSPCYDLLPDIGGWQRHYGDRLTIALVSGGVPETNRAMTAEYGITPGTVLLQADREVAEAYGVTMAPAAVLVLSDRHVGGKVVYGSQAVRQLVADSLGLVMPPQPVRTLETVGIGQPVPPLRRPDLDGNVVDWASAFLGASTLLLFWSPGCSHCQDLLPVMRAWEADPDGPRMLVVSSGPVALNREVGLRSPIVLDDNQDIARRFGVMGSPTAFVIDGTGIIASGMSRGVQEVRMLVDRELLSVRPTLRSV